MGDGAGPPCEPCLSKIMAAIHDLRGSLARRSGGGCGPSASGSLKKKVSEKVLTAETDIAHLQSTSKTLEDQVWFLTTKHEQLAVRLEDQEGRARRNNIQVVGVPEGVEGPSVELFMETLIADYLRPKELSLFSRTHSRLNWIPGI
ncbi:hypothetical protein NDU88_006701 [Pleurodeles waltl]|uniref:Uncharacterized protein n=1 Tax=Pleurodeles waltl TaxID=8319 RepID=A0AAV7LPV4_PLEWA|nr:hypothetical protein NDU88_006701 [Pleurodeles waltl]